MKNETGVTPCNNFLLIKPEPVPTKTASGLYIPEAARRHNSQRGTVVAVGPDVNRRYIVPFDKYPTDMDNAQYTGEVDTVMVAEEERINIGDTVLYVELAGEALKVGSEDYILVRKDQLKATYKENTN